MLPCAKACAYKSQTCACLLGISSHKFTQVHVGSLALQDGPHFADWGEMQGQGAVSMASAPIHMSNDVVAVLTLASSQHAAFEE